MTKVNQYGIMNISNKSNISVWRYKEMMKEFGRTRTVTLDVYDVCKYTAKTVEELNEKQIKYSACIGFEVVSGKEAEVIESETDNSCIDDFHEYLVLYFENGETATFRNSYVDLFMF